MKSIEFIHMCKLQKQQISFTLQQLVGVELSVKRVLAIAFKTSGMMRLS
jgi:hypothetical protein